MGPTVPSRLLSTQMSSPAPPTSISVLHDDAFDTLEEEFLRFAQAPDHTNRMRLTHEQRREYRSFLSNPSRKPASQREHNIRSRTRTSYQLIGTQLYQKSRDELDNVDDQAAN